ncbi:MAG TPA: lytic murein transglycosylase B, partial [Steroidobacteraceae bacterium]|nr:lytic murein transglycosylase B [Steroidobacteraceae bacterium]
MRAGRTATLLASLALLAPGIGRAVDLKRPEVKAFVDEVVLHHHLKRAWVLKVLAAAQLRPAVIEAITRPAEHVRPWFEYRALFLTEQRIREGREFYATHQAELEDAARRTGVPGEFIAAVVGIETSYGRITGAYRVLDALATLAFDYPPRAGYFRGELEQFLLLAREAKFDPLTAMGSYAGAMGAPQFMPRSYRAYAVDGDGDGRIDLWNSWPDIIESVAHYFVVHGWHAGEPVAAVADLWYPDVEDLPAGHLELSEQIGSLRSKGVLLDSTLPDDAPAVFVALRDAAGPTYRVGFHNFWVITRYNRSSMYALAVCELAAAIAPAATPSAGTPAPAVPAPATEPAAGHGPAMARGATR